MAFREKIVFFYAIVLSGCASHRIAPDQVLGLEPASLPMDIPTDLRLELEKRFEVSQPTQVKAPEKKDKRMAKRSSWEPLNRRPAIEPIWLDETLIFEITYFGMAAGTFTMKVLPYKEINGRKAYHIRAEAVSSKVFSLFYRLNDVVQTYFDYEGLFSHRFQLDLDESKQTRHALELNDSEKGQTFYWNRWDHHQKGHIETKEMFPMEPLAQDSISALYFIRTQGLKLGKSVTFPIVSEGKTFEAIVTAERTETLRTPEGKLETLVLRLDTKYQGILKREGDTYLWVTQDGRYFPVRLEAKVKIGRVVAAIREIIPGTKPGS